MTSPLDAPRPRTLPGIHRLNPSIFYGWYIVAGSFLVNCVCIGIGFYGQTVFLDALIQENGWSKSSVSGASTLYFITAGLVGLQVGRVVDRLGPRIPILAGALTTAVALIALGFVDHPAELYAVYALLAAGFAMSSSIPLSSLISHWFTEKRSRAMSWSQTGVSVGGLFFLPLATGLIAREGISGATPWLALSVVGIVPVITYFVLRSDPKDYGLAPDGAAAPAEAPPAPTTPTAPPARTAMLSSRFLLLAAAFALILICQTGLAVHHLHLLRVHLDMTTATLGIMAIPVGSIVGRLLCGVLADRIDKRWVTAGLFSTQALALAGMGLASETPTLLATSLAFGLTVGAVFMMQSLLVAEFFGLAAFATVFAALNFVTSLGGGIGPILVGLLAERSGSYAFATPVLSAIALLASGLVLLVRPISPPHSREATLPPSA